MAEKWINAIMLDVVRTTERLDYYRDLIPRLSRWGYNMLFWHFTDDQGCAIKLRSHPELASRYALTRAEVRDLIALAAANGIEVVPEIESLGHTLYITHLKKYAHLFEGSQTHFNAICPSHPQSLEIVRDLLIETAKLFPSPWLHVGLDEVQFGACPRCRKRGLQDWELFGQHINAVHEIVTSCGKQMVLWGDHLVKDERIAKLTPRDCIVAHWDYFVRDELSANNKKLLDHGFKVLCCPASARVFSVVMPDESNLANLRQFAAIGRRQRRQGVLGMVNTVWCPERQLGGATHYTEALAAALFENPKVDEQAVAERFVKQEYGLARPTSAARALRTLHEAAPGLLFLRRMRVESNAEHAFPLSPTDIDEARLFRGRLDQARRGLLLARGRVTARAKEYAMWLLAGEILDELLSRAQLWQDVAILDRLRLEALKRRDTAAAKSTANDLALILAEAARAARRSHKLAKADWQRCRQAGDPRAVGRVGYLKMAHALVGMLDRTAAYLEKLAARAARLKATGRGQLGLPAKLIAEMPELFWLGSGTRRRGKGN